MHWDISLTVGLILGAGAILGTLARKVHLPALTGYIFAGLILGRHVLDALPVEHIELISEPVNNFAMALVLFVLGGQFRWDAWSGKTGRIFAAALIEASLTILIVLLVSWIMLGDGRAALLLGVLAVAVAPATTLVVLREIRSRGPLTERITILTGLSNLITIVLFEVVLLFLATVREGSMPEGSGWNIVWDLVGSLLFGVLAGHLLILFQTRLGRGNLGLPLLTVVFLLIGACQWLDVPHMLAFLVTGAVVANRSRLFADITGSMEVFAKPAYVAFFVLGGLHLDFAVFEVLGWAVGAYVGARTLGKVVGTRLAGGLTGLPLRPTQAAGPGLLCQAGAAIALAGVVARYDEELSKLLLNVILGGVAIFELAGPILLRRVAVMAGEVPMGQLLARSMRDDDSPSWVQAFRRAFGRRHRKADLERLRVGDLVSRGAGSLKARADMHEVLRFADHSPYNHFPVVDERGKLLGVIPLSELDQVVYDPKLSGLLIASELVELGPEQSSLPANATLREAADFFQNFPGNTAAVVDGLESDKFLGMLPRSEVLLLARHMVESG